MARKKTDENVARKHKVTVRFTDDEISTIRTESTQAGLSVSEYIRTQICKGKVVVKLDGSTPNKNQRPLLEEYHKIGVNLNQIAHHLNSGDLAYEQVVDDIKRYVGDLKKLRDKAMNEKK